MPKQLTDYTTDELLNELHKRTDIVLIQYYTLDHAKMHLESVGREPTQYDCEQFLEKLQDYFANSFTFDEFCEGAIAEVLNEDEEDEDEDE